MSKKDRKTPYERGLTDGMRGLDPISMNASYAEGYHTGQQARYSGKNADLRKQAHANLENALLDRLGFVPDEDFIHRAKARWKGTPSPALHAEEKQLAREFAKRGGRGVDLADRLDSVRTAIALAETGHLL